MRIKKVSQTTPTTAQVVDGYSTSTNDSYSCNYINELHEIQMVDYTAGSDLLYAGVYYKDGLIYVSIVTNSDVTAGTGKTLLTLRDYRALIDIHAPMSSYSGFKGECFVGANSSVIEYNNPSKQSNGKAFFVIPVEPIPQ